MTKTIQKLPAPAGIDRVESGPVQFGDDWPGVFFRGDNACGLSAILSGFVVGAIEEGRVTSADFALYGLLMSFARDLAACDQSGAISGKVEQIRQHMMRSALLADAPAAGSVQ